MDIINTQNENALGPTAPCHISSMLNTRKKQGTEQIFQQGDLKICKRQALNRSGKGKF